MSKVCHQSQAYYERITCNTTSHTYKARSTLQNNDLDLLVQGAAVTLSCQIDTADV